jgi:hypothetical protein
MTANFGIAGKDKEREGERERKGLLHNAAMMV